ncbi:MAG TPA: glycosyltransferase family 2 protein [Chloroflexia bacterium]|nr:glycosyltransferase family 2 protein [Chloroflexia bacterium]
MTQSNIRHYPVQDGPTAGGLDPVPDLSVVIVSWNVKQHLVSCLQALFSGPVREGLEIEVLVIDNASSDGSAQAASDYPATVVVNETNLGYGRANNIGLRMSRGRHLMILNPDTVPTPGSLRALVEFADTHSRAGIVAPRLLNLDGTTQAAAFLFPTVPMAVLDLFPLPAVIPGKFRQALLQSRMNGRYAEEVGSLPFRIEHPLGACFLIKRYAYEQCGGFNEEIFMYSEEIDLALRYAEQKWECWQVPSSKVIHLGGQSTRQLPDLMFVELWRSRLYIYDTYYTLVARLALRAVLAAAMIRYIVMSSVSRLRGNLSRRDSQKQMRKWARVFRMAVRL